MHLITCTDECSCFAEFLNCTFVILVVYLKPRHLYLHCHLSLYLMCSICQPSPHLNYLLYVIAMAELLHTHSLDLMEAYHLLNVGSPQGVPQQ